MRIRNVRHKGLRRFVEDDSTAALQPAIVPEWRRILSFLQDMESGEELPAVPAWKAHRSWANANARKYGVCWSLRTRESHFGSTGQGTNLSIRTTRIITRG